MVLVLSIILINIKCSYLLIYMFVQIIRICIIVWIF